MIKAGRESAMAGAAKEVMLLYPRRLLVVVNCGLQVLAILVAILGASGWQRLSPFGRVIIPLGVALLTLAAVDGIQKRYEVSYNMIRVRTLFRWKVILLASPPRAYVHAFDGVRVIATENDKPLLTIPKDFGPTATIADQLNRLWGVQLK